jgi:hypothetical protein
LFDVPQGSSGGGGGDSGDAGGGSNILSLVSGLLGSSSGVSMNTIKYIFLSFFLPDSLILSMVFKNPIRISVFGPKRDEVIGVWRKLHNEALHNLYSSPSLIRMIKSRRIRWEGYIARMGRNGGRVLVGKIEGNRPLGRPRRRWVNNIKMHLTEIGWGGMDCTHLT